MYNSLLKIHGKTLKDISKSKISSATTITDEAIDFDDYVHQNFPQDYKPSSCDALYCNSTNDLFLIEFKNGGLDFVNSQIDKISKKILDSLLILIKVLPNATIDYFRKKLTFILVYNSANSKTMMRDHLGYKAAINPNIYSRCTKNFFIQDAKDFDRDFVNNYC